MEARCPLLSRVAPSCAEATPDVSVLLPVHNGCTPSPARLHAALRSLLGQTLRALEVVAVDDGSTDCTAAVLSAYAASDARVRVLPSDGARRGVAAALNRALRHCHPSTRWIARMDADDVSDACRLALQVRFMEQHPHVDVVGTAVRVHSEGADSTRDVALPSEEGMSEWAMAFFCCLAHPSVLLRRSSLQQPGVLLDPSALYSASPLHAHVEDVELWLRLVRAQRSLTSLPPPTLLTLTRHSRSSSSVHAAQQRHSALHLARAHLEELTRHRVQWTAAERLLYPGGVATAAEAVAAASLLLLLERCWVLREEQRPLQRRRPLRCVSDDVTARLGELALLAVKLRNAGAQGGAAEMGYGADECGPADCAWYGEGRAALSAEYPPVPAMCADDGGLMAAWLRRSGGAQSAAQLAQLSS